jgi:hypothetical protein
VWFFGVNFCVQEELVSAFLCGSLELISVCRKN